MLRISTYDTDREFVMKLEGALAGAWVGELDAFWREAAWALRGRQLRVDVRDVSHVDAAGRALMTTMYLEGVRFITAGCVMPEVVREISHTVDRPYPAEPAPVRAGGRGRRH
jgi:hypothetical protein